MPSKKRKYKVDLVTSQRSGRDRESPRADSRVVNALPHEFRFIYVNDGSEDGTEKVAAIGEAG
ncbi:MAG: hypothetical protein U0V48_11385 [Anaerolineales bacterium]